MPQNRVITNGGVASVESENGCANGASGTVFRIEADSLNLDNKGIPVTAATTISIPGDRYHNGSKSLPELASTVVLQGNANLVIEGEHFGLTFNSLTMLSNSKISFGEQPEWLHIRFTENTHIAKSSVLDFTKTRYVTLF